MSEEGARPKVLSEAHELVLRKRPEQGASSKVWLNYLRDSAKLYAEVAETDRGHHHEALYWAGSVRARAEDMAAQLAENKRGVRPPPMPPW